MNKLINSMRLDECLAELKQYQGDLTNGLRFDDRVTGLFSRTLEWYSKEIVRQRTPDTNCEALIPHQYVDLYGVQKIMTTYVEGLGQANYGTDADDVTFVDVGISEEGLPITEIRIGYKWREAELEADMVSMRSQINSGLSIVREAMANADKVLREEFHKSAIYGVARRNITGLFNNPFVVPESITTFYPYDVDTTREQLYDWIISLHGRVEEQTNRYTSVLNTMLISQGLRDQLMKLPSVSASDATAYDLLKRTLGERGVTNFVVRNEVSRTWLEKYGFFASGTNRELMVIYNNNSDCLKRYVSPIRQSRLYFDEKGTASQNFRQRVSSVKFDNPLEALYVSYPTVQAP
jgi:hypothetical protein